MDKKIQKPIGLLRKEFVQELGKVINNSQLPLYIVLPIVQAMSSELSQMLDQQENKEIEEYNNSLSQSETD